MLRDAPRLVRLRERPGELNLGNGAEQAVDAMERMLEIADAGDEVQASMKAWMCVICIFGLVTAFTLAACAGGPDWSNR